VQEAKTASALNRPNIITIHDIAKENGTDFIVIEYVQGKTLDARVPRKGLRLNGRRARQSPLSRNRPSRPEPM
jgi:serine/threonine protein kinase